MDTMKIARNPKTLVILLTIAAFALATSTLAAVTVTHNLNSIGTINTSPNIDIFGDSACNTPINSVNWGSIAAGGSSTQTVYIKNIGTGSMTLSMTVTGWAPSNAGTYITMSWNREGTTLAAGQSTAATVTLNVASGIAGISSFSNTITFTGTG
jgi:hypothetical protein